MKKLFAVPLSLALVIFLSGISICAEHPGEHPGMTASQEEHKEHPGKTHEEEHPGKAGEHPGEAAEHPGEHPIPSAAQIIKAIKDHIENVTKANDGYFPITDPEEGKELRLKLIKVHEDKVSHIKKEDACFACTDFETEDGLATYDIDFWMRKGRGGELEVYQTKIHKKDGEARFTYKDDEIVPVE